MAILLAFFRRQGASERVSRLLAWSVAAGALFAAVMLLLSIWNGLDFLNDRKAVADAATKANAEMLEAKDTATGKADANSADRGAEQAHQVRKTEELIDEALEKNCVVSDYLASNGTDCVRAPHSVPSAAAK